MRLVPRRRDEAVGDDVIDEIGAQGAGIAEIVDLDRGWSQGGDLGASQRGVARQVHQYVHPVGMDPGSGVGVRHRADFHEAVECPLEPRPHRAAVIGAVGIGRDFETASVVQFEQFRDQGSHRVLAKVSRQVADPQPAGRAPFVFKAQALAIAGNSQRLALCIMPGALQLLLRRGRDGEQAEGENLLLGFFQGGATLLPGQFLEPRPVADTLHLEQQAAPRGGISGLESQCRLVTAQRLIVCAHQPVRGSEIEMSVGEFRVELNGLAIALDRLVRAVALHQGIAELAVDHRVVGRVLQRAAVMRLGLVQPALGLQRNGQLVMRVGKIRLELEALAQALDRFFPVAGKLPAGQREAEPYEWMVGRQLQRAAIQSLRLGKLRTVGGKQRQVEQHFRIARFEFQYPAEVLFRLLRPAQLEQDQGEVVDRGRIVGRQHHGAPKARHGADQIARRLAGVAETFQILGVGGFQHDSPLQLGEAEGRLIALQQLEAAPVTGGRFRVPGRPLRFRHFTPASRQKLLRLPPTWQSRTERTSRTRRACCRPAPCPA